MNEPWTLTFLVMTTLILFVIFLVIWFIRRIREQKLQEQREMDLFQRDIEREFGDKERLAASNEEGPFVETRYSTSREEGVFSPASPPSPPVPEMVSAPSTEIPSGDAVQPSSLIEQVIMRLKEANLFESSEGHYLPLDPSGECLLIKLKGKKTALLVPRFESQHFIRNALKRFDYVFLISSKEDVVVIESFSGFIAGHYKLS